MSDEEFSAAIRAITAGVPAEVVMTRLVHLVRALVESGGPPAVDLIRMVVQLRERADDQADELEASAESREWDMS